MNKVICVILILSSSPMLATPQEASKTGETASDYCFCKAYFNVPESCTQFVIENSNVAGEASNEPVNYHLYEELNSERIEFLVENLKWRVKDVLDANGRVKPEAVDTAQELLREACGHYTLIDSLVTLLEAGVNPHTEVKGLLSPKEIAARYNTFALWILEAHEKKATSKSNTTK